MFELLDFKSKHHTLTRYFILSGNAIENWLDRLRQRKLGCSSQENQKILELICDTNERRGAGN